MKSLFKINHKCFVAAKSMIDAINVYYTAKTEAPSVYDDVKYIEVVADEILI